MASIFNNLLSIFGLGKQQKYQEYNIQPMQDTLLSTYTGKKPVASLLDTVLGKQYNQTLQDRISGINVGYQPNLIDVEKTTAPFATQRMATLKNYELPAISASASSRGLGKSTIVPNMQSLKSQEAAQDIESRIAELQTKNVDIQNQAAQQKSQEIANAVAQLGQLTEAEAQQMGKAADYDLNQWKQEQANKLASQELAYEQWQNAQNQSQLNQANKTAGLQNLVSLASPLIKKGVDKLWTGIFGKATTPVATNVGGQVGGGVGTFSDYSLLNNADLYTSASNISSVGGGGTGVAEAGGGVAAGGSYGSVTAGGGITGSSFGGTGAGASSAAPATSGMGTAAGVLALPALFGALVSFFNAEHDKEHKEKAIEEEQEFWNEDINKPEVQSTLQGMARAGVNPDEYYNKWRSYELATSGMSTAEINEFNSRAAESAFRGNLNEIAAQVKKEFAEKRANEAAYQAALSAPVYTGLNPLHYTDLSDKTLISNLKRAGVPDDKIAKVFVDYKRITKGKSGDWITKFNNIAGYAPEGAFLGNLDQAAKQVR